MQFKNRNRRKLGFTLTELLVVVAIIAILAAVAAPGYGIVRDNLHMLELDEAALTIFTTAQNRMSELRTSGVLTDDFGGTRQGDEDSTIYVIASSDPAMDTLFTTGMLEAKLNAGCFYIEYNSETGMVLSVFYSDERFDYSDTLPTERDDRRVHEPRLGYYGADDISLGENDTVPAPEFELVNAGTLHVNLTLPRPAPAYTYNLTVSDSTNEVVFEDITSLFFQSTNVNVSSTEDSSAITHTIVLDGLDSALQFKTLFPTLKPGADLTVSMVTVSGGSKSVPTEKTANSLFDSRSGGDVFVANSRHLQNLDLAFSEMDNDVTSASLTGAVTWQASRSFVAINNSGLESFNGNGNGIIGLNAPLFDSFGSTNSAIDYSISKVRLVNSVINVTQSQNLGTLVNTAVNTDFDDCRVYAYGGFDASTLQSREALNTGGLIGKASGCTVTDCLAALNRISTNAPSYASAYTGGLIGFAENTVISKSFANTGYRTTTDVDTWHTDTNGYIDVGIIAEIGTVGGLVGGMSAGSVSDCYSVGNIAHKGAVAAGFVGMSMNGAGYENSYSAMTFKDSAATTTHGFTPLALDPSYRCYYLGNGSINGEASGNLSYADLKTCMRSPAWSLGSKITTVPYGLDDEGYPFQRLKLHYGDWPDETVSSEGVLAYYEIYSNGKYGFYAEDVKGTVLINTLINGAETALVEDGYAILTGSLGSTATIYTEVYSSSSTSWRANLSQTGTAFQTVTDTTDRAVSGYFMRPNTGILKAYETQSFEQARREFYWSLSLRDASGNELLTNALYFNPAFAKTAVNAAKAYPEYAPISGGIKGSIEIRSPRQLFLLSWLTHINWSGYEKADYQQTRVIDFTKYNVTYAMHPISDTAQFSGSYNGNYNIITGTGITPRSDTLRNNIGLFGVTNNNSILKNIFFVSDYGSTTVREITGNNNVGGLVGLAYNGTNISNCTVAGFNISGNSNVGGLVGQLNGTAAITASSASHYTVGETGGSISGVSHVGGLVGHADGSITRSYAVATVSDNAYGLIGDGWGRAYDSYSIVRSASGYITRLSPNATTTNSFAFNGSNLATLTVAFRAWGSPSLANSHPYSADLDGQNYYFPSSVVGANGSAVHYGNWPQQRATDFLPEAGLVYYERYSDSTWGFYTSEENSSLVDGKTIVEDGYTVFIKDNKNPTAYIEFYTKGNNGQYKLVATTQKLHPTNFKAPDGYIAYVTPDFRSINGYKQMTDIYVKLTVHERTFYYNPSFAHAFGTDRNAPSDATFVIRTPRHLAELSIISNYSNPDIRSMWLSKSYMQTANIDFRTYAKINQNINTIAGSGSFSGIYDGSGNTISGISRIDTTDNSGLFGFNTGIIRDVHLIGGAVGTSKGAKGQFVGENRGTITNCSVSGCSGANGAFYGINTGTITNCTIDNNPVN